MQFLHTHPDSSDWLRRSHITHYQCGWEYIQNCMLKMPIWAYNKLPFFKLIKHLYVSLQSQFTYFCKSNINQTFTNGGGMIWGVRIVIFTEIRHLVEELITFLPIFGPQNLYHLTDYKKVSQYQLECNERGLVCNKACPNLSQLLRVWYFMWALMHAQQVSWIGIIVFWNIKEGLCLYHVFKLLILLFGVIMMFLPSLTRTDYIGWKHQA